MDAFIGNAWSLSAKIHLWRLLIGARLSLLPARFGAYCRGVMIGMIAMSLFNVLSVRTLTRMFSMPGTRHSMPAASPSVCCLWQPTLFPLPLPMSANGGTGALIGVAMCVNPRGQSGLPRRQ